MDMINDAAATNTSVAADAFLTMEDLGIADVFVYPVFVIGTLTYLLIMLFNCLVLASITLCKQLHSPMFLLLYNLQISDMFGASAFFPHFLFSVVTRDRSISFPACIIQTFLIHAYGTANFLTLSFMAYDRYIAICHPLKYKTIMSPSKLVKMILLIWFFSISPILILILMQRQLKYCRTHIVDVFCNNPSIVRMSCGNTRNISYYGMISNIIYQTSSLCILLFTYGQILRRCILTNTSDTWNKAILTCGTHLAVYLLLEINVLITLVSHRLEIVSPNIRKALGVSIVVFPPLLDPLIYGLRTKQLKEGIMMIIRRALIAKRL